MADFRTIRIACARSMLVAMFVLGTCQTSFGRSLAQPMAQAAAQQDSQEAFQLAAGHYERGEWDEATTAFESIIHNYAGTSEADTAHFFLGEALMQRQDFQNAYLAWQEYLNRQPDGTFAARSTFRMGEVTMRLEQFPRSIRLLETYVDQYPGDSLMQFALAYLGEMRLTRKEPQLAQRVFEAGLRINPSGAIANKCRFGLGRSLQVQGNTLQALDFYDFIVREPGNELRSAASLEAGIIHFAEASYDSANDLLGPIVESNSILESPIVANRAEIQSKAHYWLGRIALVSDDFSLALDHFRQMDFDIVADDVAIAACFDGAIAATRAGDDRQATQWLDQLIDDHPDHDLVDDARFMQLRNAFDQDDSVLGAQLAEAFLEKHPDSPFRNQVNELLGQWAYHNGRYQETIQRFEDLLETQPSTSDGHAIQRLTWSYYLALGKIGLEQFDQAETILQSLAASNDLLLDKSKPGSLSTLVQIALATTRFSQGKAKSAIPNYENYLAITGRTAESAAAQNELILCYAKTGLWRQARDSFELLPTPMGTTDQISKLSVILSLALQSPEKSDLEFWYSALKSDNISGDQIQAASLAEIAWMKLEQGDQASADRLFDELLDRFPTHPSSAKAGIARAKRFELAKDFTQAEAAYAQVAKNFADQPSGSVARLRRAYALHKMKTPDSLQRAGVMIDAWISDQANQVNATPADQDILAEAIYQAAWVYADQNDSIQRDLRFEELVRNHPDSKYWPDAAYRVAQQHVRRREFERATQLIQSIQKHGQTPAKILDRSRFMLGQINAKQKLWLAAETTFKTLAEQSDDVSLRNRSTYWLAESLYRQQKFAQAGKGFSSLMKNPVTALASLRPWILLRSAQCMAKTENWKDAASVSKLAMKEQPGFSLIFEFQFFVARAMEESGLLNDAIIEYQKVLDSSAGGATETAAMAQWRIGEIRFHQEDYRAAIQAYYRVDSIFGYPRWRSAALLQAGKCQEHLENWKHAEKLYRQLLKLFPDSELAADAQARLTHLQSLAAKDITTPTTRKQR